MREMAQRNVQWYSVHTNGVELREMAQRNIEWYSVHTNISNENKSAGVLKFIYVRLDRLNRNRHAILALK